MTQPQKKRSQYQEYSPLGSEGVRYTSTVEIDVNWRGRTRLGFAWGRYTFRTICSSPDTGTRHWTKSQSIRTAEILRKRTLDVVDRTDFGAWLISEANNDRVGAVFGY